MYCNHTDKVYYIGTKVRDLTTNKEGTIYKINVLGTNGIRVLFSDNTKKGYFGTQICNLLIIGESSSSNI